MIPAQPWPAMAARFFRGPLDHLCRALDALAERLREAVARVVGETVARVVGGVVHALMEDASADVAADDRPDRLAGLWDERPGAGSDLALSYEDTGAADARGQGPALSSTRLPPQRRVKALALGCQATAWWLGRPTGEPRIAAALGVGIVTAVAAYVGGPVVAAGAALAGTAAALAALAGLTRVVAAALARAEEF
jgi:hypothetical protein